MGTNQFDWVAPTEWPAYDAPQADFNYSALGQGISIFGSQVFTNYNVGLFGEFRFGIGAFNFDNAPVELINLTLTQPDPVSYKVYVDFDFRDFYDNVNTFTYEWKLASGGVYKPALMTPPLLNSVTNQTELTHHTVFWDVRNEPDFAMTSAAQTIRFRITATDGSFTKVAETAPTIVFLNDAPLIVSFPPVLAYKNVEYAYSPVAMDMQNDITYWSLVGAPLGMQFDVYTGKITWTPQTETIDPLILSMTVHDAKGLFDSQSFVLNVVRQQVNLQPKTAFPTVVKNAFKTGGAQISLSSKNVRDAIR